MIMNEKEMGLEYFIILTRQLLGNKQLSGSDTVQKFKPMAFLATEESTIHYLSLE